MGNLELLRRKNHKELNLHYEKRRFPPDFTSHFGLGYQL